MPVPDQLNKKIQDYSQYVRQAVSNFRNRQYADAAYNCRKAAEACCKVLLYHAFNANIAEVKISNKNLKELIKQVISDNAAERKAINNLEALQIVGNKAAHDNPLSAEEAGYAMNALHLLNDYLFTEKLRISYPAELRAALLPPETKTSGPEKIIIREKVIEREIDSAASEELLKKLQAINDTERAKYEEYFSEKEKLLKEEWSRAEQLRIAAAAATAVSAPKKSRKPYLIAGGVALVLLCFFTVFKLNGGEEKPANRALLTLNKHSDTIYVAINKLQVMQDNPQVDYNLENYLASEIARKMAPHNLPLSLRFTDLGGREGEADSIISRAERLGYDVVFLGRLFETALNDSNILEMRGLLLAHKQFDRDKKVRFKSMADSTVIKEMNDQANIAIYRYTQVQENKRPYAELAAILGGLAAYSVENYLFVYESASFYMYRARMFKEAEPIVRKLLSLAPRVGNFHQALGNILWALERTDTVEACYNTAIALDSTKWIFYLSYGDFKLFRHDKAAAEQYYRMALRCDSTVDLVKERLANINNFETPEQYRKKTHGTLFMMASAFERQNQYEQALRLYQQIYVDDPDYPELRTGMASSYYFMGRRAEALKMAREALNADSTTAGAPGVYASLLFKVHPEKKAEIEHYFKLARRCDPNTSASRVYAHFLLAYGEFEKCAAVCEEIKLQRPSDLLNIRCLAKCYLSMRKFNEAIPQLEYIDVVAPNDSNCVMLAQCYYQNNFSTGPLHDKGVKLLHRALSINPRSALAHIMLARYLVSARQHVQGAIHYRKARELNPALRDTQLEQALAEAGTVLN